MLQHWCLYAKIEEWKTQGQVKEIVCYLLRSCTLMYDLYKITKVSSLKERSKESLKYSKTTLEWQTGNGAFKTVDCKKTNLARCKSSQA